MDSKPTAHINDWFTWGPVLVGKISQHPTQDRFLMEHQMTSPVVAWHWVEGIGIVAETQNTVYTLGRPFVIREPADLS